MAIVSSYKNRPFDERTIVFGEVGLSGEVRAVNMPEQRVAEAKKLGNPKVFNTIIIGVAAKHMDFDHDKWVEVIKATVPPKTVEMNLKAFEVGYAL